MRRSGSSLRVATKLIDIASDSAVWTHKYSGTSEDVFTIQESISRGIVDALHLVLSPRESQRLLARPLDDIRAYESYLKAKQEMLTFTKEGLDRALSFLKNSEQLVGENLLLLSATDYVYWQYVNAGIDNDPANLQKARAAAERILALAPESEHGYRLLGLVQIHEGDIQGGIKSLKRALEIDPNDPDTLVWLCVFCGITGKAAAARPWGGASEDTRSFDSPLPGKSLTDESTLFHADVDGKLAICDTRPAARAAVTVLADLDRELFLQCDGATDIRRLTEIARGDGGGATEEAIAERLEPPCVNGLMLRDGRRYLALSVKLGTYKPPRAARRALRNTMASALIQRRV